jgi:hypothetical protein
MKKLFTLIAIVCLALLFVGETVGQSVGGLYYARLGVPFHVYGTASTQIFSIKYEDSYFTVSSNSGSYPIRFFPEGTTSYVLEIQDDQIVIPSGKTLTVAGTFTPSGSTGNMTMADGSWVGLGAAKGRIVFDDDTNDELGIMNARVGIGTLAPAHALEIVGNVAIGDSTTGDVDAFIYFQDDASVTAESFAWDDGNGSFQLTDDIQLTGNVSLGDSTTGDVDAIIYFADDASQTAESLTWNDGNDQFEISDDFTAGSNDITADSLLGTTGARIGGLEVSSITHQTTDQSLTVSTNGIGDLIFDITAATGIDGDILFGDTGTALETVTIDSNGYVGIGVAPTGPIQVVTATADTIMLLEADGDLFMESLGSGTGTALHIVTGTDEIVIDSSSELFKDDIEDWDIDTKALLKLKPRSFVWNDKSALPGAEDKGFIAEEVAKAFPEGANYRDGKVNSWNKGKVIALLVAHNQELEKRIAELEKRVK